MKPTPKVTTVPVLGDHPGASQRHRSQTGARPVERGKAAWQTLAILTIVACVAPQDIRAQHGDPHRAHHGMQLEASHHGAGHEVHLPPSASTPATGTANAAPPPAEPEEFITTHSINVAGNTLRYQAVAEEIYLQDAQGNPAASIFAVSYFKQELIGAPETRPITFVFNGGPGSSSVWLHLGAFGPKRLDLGPDPLDAGAPPYALNDNPHTLLTHTDLVFIDPVGTGYSRPLGDGKAADYYGVDEDAAAIAQFIRTYLRQHKRWKSPRYLAGESYGTTRAALLIRELSLNTLNGVSFNGVILISAALDVRLFQSGGPGNELPYVTHLPTYAATAYYHEQLPERPDDLDAFLREVRQFAATDYLAALFQGSSLSEDRANAIASRLHRYTGLREDFLLRCNLRVSTARFLKELLRERGETLAMHDTRFRGQDPDEAGERVRWDPFISAMDAPFVSSINSYLGEDLDVDMGREYQAFSILPNMTWKRPRAQQTAFSGYLHTATYLAEAAALNRDFRVFVASGYHDLTTSFFGVEYTMNQSGIDEDRITLRNYHGGHMMYLNASSLEQLSGDVRSFLEARRNAGTVATRQEAGR